MLAILLKCRMGAMFAAVLFLLAPAFSVEWPQYKDNPFVIQLAIPAPTDSAGGLITADLDGDGLMDYLITVRGHLAVYGHDGKKLWIYKGDIVVGGSSEREGLPGHHGPGVTVADMDANGEMEVLFLTKDSTLHVLDAKSGKPLWQARIPVPKGAEKWEHLAVANFQGQGDSDLLLQATNKKGYRTGRYICAYSYKQLRDGESAPLWERDDFLSCAHNGARLADLNGDGRDEVIGGTLLGPDGKLLFRCPVKGHLDSIFVADVRPDIPGLEVVSLEEGGGNRVFLFNTKGLLWETHYKHQEPQNAAVGEFSKDHSGLEIWCRSRYNTHQKPFVFDSKGKLIAEYEMDKVAPKGWTDAGVEVIFNIDWTGDAKHLAAAKERHTEGDIGVFDPISGEFLARFSDKAARLYVADVSGDAREEMIVLNSNQLHIYHNEKVMQQGKPRRWQQQHYRRSKLTWNYYSP
jgi:5-hydroxyisourate hydrolase-like protein (transthyretin family)